QLWPGHARVPKPPGGYRHRRPRRLISRTGAGEVHEMHAEKLIRNRDLRRGELLRICPERRKQQPQKDAHIAQAGRAGSGSRIEITPQADDLLPNAAWSSAPGRKLMGYRGIACSARVLPGETVS